MKKPLIYTLIGIVGIFIIAFIYFNTYETTPVMKNVENIHLEFLNIDENGKFSDPNDRTKRKVTDPADKDFLITFFNNEFKIGLFACDCPHGDIIITFEADNKQYVFELAVGVRGDPNIYYCNAGNHCDYADEQLAELLAFFSKFDETANYNLDFFIGTLSDTSH